MTDASHAPDRAILIGTPDTLAPLAAQLATCKGLPTIVGAVLAEGQIRGESRLGSMTLLGVLDDLPAITRALRPTVGIVSLPAAGSDLILRVRQQLDDLGLAERLVPVLDEVLAEPGVLGMLAGVGGPGGSQNPVPPAALGPRIDTASLIDRVPHEIDRALVGRQITGRRVLVTGAGGSIGSELARIACGFDPELIVLMERSENALFEIDRQIARRFPGVRRRPMLHDVVDADATFRRIAEVRPHLVLHAAAHKHVPLMEEHPADAVTNNLFGTKGVADACQQVGVERMVLISTDKAVNPTSVMGATKRLAERYVQFLHHRGFSGPGGAGTRYSIVRFGNVLGSAGSVLPIWSAQLAEGGPITLTDPRMTRYFMTIREAASLVLQAASMDHEPLDLAPVFVLDMGRPVRILEMAQRFVRAHGFEPRLVRASTDPAVLSAIDGVLHAAGAAGRPAVDIVITGIRPGEKLHEELAYHAELLTQTEHPGITAWTAESPPLADVTDLLADMGRVRASEDHRAVLEAISRHVPELVRPAPVRRAS